MRNKIPSNILINIFSSWRSWLAWGEGNMLNPLLSKFLGGFVHYVARDSFTLQSLSCIVYHSSMIRVLLSHMAGAPAICYQLLYRFHGRISNIIVPYLVTRLRKYSYRLRVASLCLFYGWLFGWALRYDTIGSMQKKCLFSHHVFNPALVWENLNAMSITIKFLLVTLFYSPHY